VDDSNDNPIISTEAAEELQSSAAAVEPSAPAAPRQPPKRADLGLLAPVIAIIAWLVPGLGHLLLRRWGRALAFFVAVGGLVITGYLMRGNVFPPHSQDPFGTLGFIADASSGVFYLLARVVEVSGPNVSRAVGDYGTRFIAAAGIVNVLAICDAYEIAARRRR
jgi:uncharacterized protein DUF6677